MPLTSSAWQVYLNKRTRRAGGRPSGSGRYCCKSLFALLIKNSLGCRRDFRVKMWGTSSPDGKLTTLKKRTLSPTAQLFIKFAREVAKPLAKHRDVLTWRKLP